MISKRTIMPIVSDHKYEGLLKQVEYKRSIPKTIHQTYKTHFLPSPIQESICKMLALNPTYCYHLYDDEEIIDYIRENYGQRILSYYLRIHSSYGAAKADFFRYLLIYNEGGIYLDIKSTVTQSLDLILGGVDTCLLSKWENHPGEKFQGWGMHDELMDIEDGEFVQWAVISAQGHPFLRRVIINMLRGIDEYSPFTHGVGVKGVLRTTGPILYTLSIEELRDEYPDDYKVVNFSKLGIEYSIFDEWRHKNVIKSNYHTNYYPVINSNLIRDSIYIFFNKLKSLLRR